MKIIYRAFKRFRLQMYIRKQSSELKNKNVKFKVRLVNEVSAFIQKS